MDRLILNMFGYNKSVFLLLFDSYPYIMIIVVIDYINFYCFLYRERRVNYKI